jgi:hypothetical protein
LYWTGNSSYPIFVPDRELEVCIVNIEVNFGVGALEIVPWRFDCLVILEL